MKNFVRGEEDTPKSHRVRSVPLSDQAFVALDALSRREHFTGPEDLVLGSEVGGHLLDDVVRDAFYEALDDAGLGELRAKDDPIVFHDLRHTFGTLAIRVAPVTDVQHWMGHADIQTTMRYVHYVPQHDNAVKLTAAFTAGGVPPDERAAWPARAARTDDVGDERIARRSRIAEAEASERAASGAFAYRPRR